MAPPRTQAEKVNLAVFNFAQSPAYAPPQLPFRRIGPLFLPIQPRPLGILLRCYFAMSSQRQAQRYSGLDFSSFSQSQSHLAESLLDFYTELADCPGSRHACRGLKRDYAQAHRLDRARRPKSSTTVSSTLCGERCAATWILSWCGSDHFSRRYSRPLQPSTRRACGRNPSPQNPPSSTQRKASVVLFLKNCGHIRHPGPRTTAVRAPLNLLGVKSLCTLRGLFPRLIGRVT
ncbi:hypothetical protein K438DRAFT_1797529 [Mycena galopus ATCC 62051]|nr:hypothetical protein K438DRAFT_1797529 [Mycena galopus ATCC 62051]